MQKQILQKIEEIKKMLGDGVSEKDIINKKFKRSVKLYNDWMLKYKDYFFNESLEIVEVNNNLPINNFNPSDIGKLKILVDNFEEIMSSINNKSYIEDVAEVLNIPNELLKIEDVTLLSVRLSKEIKKQFDEFSEENKQYSKTTLLNFAILEMIKKYK